MTGWSHRYRRQFAAVLAAIVVVAGIWYLRHIDFPSTDGTSALREIAGYSFAATKVHYYESRNFMDTWHLFRATVKDGDVARYATAHSLESRGEVEFFDLIISRPPPYWWHPERLPRAELFEGLDASGRSISLMHDRNGDLVYMLVYW